MTRLVIGSYPTPVERLGPTLPAPSSGHAGALFVKHDEGANAVYGGNKVRKLELLFGAARARGLRRILTVGAAGSHQVVATAMHGARLGFEVEAVLVPQPWSSHAERNLRVALAHGLVPFAAPAWSLAPLFVASRLRRDTYFIPLGGSNPLGSLGFVDAARELVKQVRDGELPEPDEVILPVGSGGTAAGLAVGFEEAGLRTRIVGVAVSRPARVLAWTARSLARRTAKLVGLSTNRGRRAASRIVVDGRWIGRGYALSTRESREAMQTAASCGLALDAAYTAKAFACTLARLREGADRTILYWHTLACPLEGEPEHDLPPSLERLFRRT